MKIVEKIMQFFSFSIIFYALIFPAGILLRIFSDRHRIRARASGETYFNFRR
jgi:prolipoprotein diacylglyceryltransferase